MNRIFQPKPWLQILAALPLLSLVACSQSVGANNDGINFVKKDGTNPALVAKYGEKEITADELEKSSPEIFAARLEVFEAQKRAVEEYVRQAILEDLAKKAGKATEQYVMAEMESAKKKVNDEKVMAFLKARNVRDPDKVPPQLKDQVRGLIHMQNLVASATKKNPVELYLKRPQAPKLAIKTEGEAQWGNADAPVQIVEFSDFQCPYCAKGMERLNELKKKYGKKIHVVFKHFPLPNHPEARPASEASMCINEQNSDKFWKFHDKVFENQDKMAVEDLKKYAKEVGADMKKFEECFAAKKYAAHVEASIEEARKLGVNSTPSFFVNSQPVRGAQDLAVFSEIIDEALETKKN